MRKTKEVEKIRQKRNNFRMIILMTGILSMAFFYLLYACNNKYTTGENKSIQGILYADCGEDSVSFLSGEWEYYPDVLLTPQKRRENKDEYERRYLSIGQYGGMDLGDGDKTPFGSGTYRLLVVFPEKEQTYGIALDEIFSAYRLYVDGELIGEMGNLDPEHFEARIQNRVFTFKAKGTVEIMIAVTDRNSPYSGIQYVPVLGSPFQVNLWRGGRIFFNILSLAFVLFVLLFAGYMFLKTMELCRILGNLLETAAEAVSLRENGEAAFVKAVVKIRNQKLLIEISNSCFNEIQRKGNRFYSTGHEGLGTGTASVMETALRYGGLADFTAEDGIFRAKVVLPLE